MMGGGFLTSIAWIYSATTFQPLDLRGSGEFGYAENSFVLECPSRQRPQHGVGAFCLAVPGRVRGADAAFTSDRKPLIGKPLSLPIRESDSEGAPYQRGLLPPERVPIGFAFGDDARPVWIVPVQVRAKIFDDVVSVIKGSILIKRRVLLVVPPFD